MEAEFWQQRWRQGQIGFHRPDFHPALERYWRDLGVAPRARVLVPLCGRSLDMIWLAGHGHPVLGVELSEIAVADFFEHESLVAQPTVLGGFTRHAAGPYEILQGDFFDLTYATVGAIGAWYDRAALVALPPAMRRRYARHLGNLLESGVHGLLLTHEYPQDQMSGPPFSVPFVEVEELYGPSFDIELLHRQDVIAGNPKFAERGLENFHELVIRMVRH